MKIYYRISDASYHKCKLPGADKIFCLENFISAFQKESIDIIADNCNENTIARLLGMNLPIDITNLGNAGSFRYVLNKSLGESEDYFYFVEDDYLHLPNSLEILQDAMDANIGDYFTLYDHPDKYSADYGGGEVSKVQKVGNHHWRYSQSTTMTFACMQKTLMEDFGIWEKHVSGRHPNDHEAFTELIQSGRRLAVSIPGKACHVDLTWGMSHNRIAIEPWAMEIMTKRPTD